MADLSSLAKSMRSKAKAIPELANGIAIAAVSAGLKDMVEVTPVDTSEAESNWRIGVGSAPAGSLPPFFSGRFGSTRAVSAESALREGSAALQTKQPGQSVWLSNTAKHIGDLDRGTSKQFPGGFIPRASIIIREAAQIAAKTLWK